MTEKDNGRYSGAFEEFAFKRDQARKRLGSEFLAFVKVNEGRSYFVFGGKGATEFYQGPTFGARIIGATTREVREVENVLRRMQEETASEYSPIDFYASLASQMMSNYLEQVSCGEGVPQATAVAIMFYDMFGNLTVVDFDGDYEKYELPNIKQAVFIAACFNKSTRRLIEKALKSVLKLKEPDDKKLAKIMLPIQKKLKLKYLGIAEIQTGYDEGEEENETAS
jgi:hypothetical protein